MAEVYSLKWEQIVANRVVKKEKFFATSEKRDQFRKEVMQKKQFFRLLTIKGDTIRR